MAIHLHCTRAVYLPLAGEESAEWSAKSRKLRVDLSPSGREQRCYAGCDRELYAATRFGKRLGHERTLHEHQRSCSADNIDSSRTNPAVAVRTCWCSRHNQPADCSALPQTASNDLLSASKFKGNRLEQAADVLRECPATEQTLVPQFEIASDGLTLKSGDIQPWAAFVESPPANPGPPQQASFAINPAPPGPPLFQIKHQAPG